MDIPSMVRAISSLGAFMRQFSTEIPVKNPHLLHNDPAFDHMDRAIEMAGIQNSWFLRDQVAAAFQGWSSVLTEEKLTTWLMPYASRLPASQPQTVAVIMAGNIPLVGFHDLLTVLVSGHHALVKRSTNDLHLIPALLHYLYHFIPDWKDKVVFAEGPIQGYQRVIATGSTNTARYFEHYFKDTRAIIRKNRNSVAIIRGNESEEELKGLGEDIFRYFGLGCRSVSKLYIPKEYDINTVFKVLYPWNTLLKIAKYTNNYDYNKAVYLMTGEAFLDNGFVMLKEDTSFASPIAAIFYERYDSEVSLRMELDSKADNIQCIVGNKSDLGEIPFGKSQHPELWDYADGVDTLKFLLEE